MPVGHSVSFEALGISRHFPLVVDDLWEYKENMPKKGSPPLEGELLQGTLDLLILQTLALRPGHGHTIAYAIEHRSEDVLQVQHGSLYPALHRLEDRGWIASFWGTSENNRTLPNSGFPAGRKSEANLYDSSYRQEIRLRILLTKHLGSGVAWGEGQVGKAARPPGRREERAKAQTDANLECL